MGVESLSEQVKRMTDIEAIRRLLADYCYEVDHRTDTSFVRRIFTEDAIDDHGLFGKVFQGWSELEEMYERSSQTLELAAHFVTNEQIDLDGDTAAGRSYVQCYTWLRESSHLGNVRPVDYVFVGVYHDKFVRTPDGWRIKERLMKQLGPGALGTGTPHPVYFAGYQRPDYEPSLPTSASGIHG